MVQVVALIALFAPLVASLLYALIWHAGDAGNDDPRNRHKPL